VALPNKLNRDYFHDNLDYNKLKFDLLENSYKWNIAHIPSALSMLKYLSYMIPLMKFKHPEYQWVAGKQFGQQAYYTIYQKIGLEKLIPNTIQPLLLNGINKEFAYVEAHKYADAASLVDGEVGKMYEVRFIEAEEAPVFAGKGATVPNGYAGTLAYTGTIGSGAKFDVHAILFPTQDAFATVGLKGQGKIVFNSKSPEAVELVNPYGTTGFFSYNFFYAGIILQPEKLLAVYVGATK
jgi:hypothetical protein